MQIMYGNVVLSSYNIFQDQTSLCFENAPFFHFMLVLLFIFCSVQKQGGHFYFQANWSHLFQIASSVAEI